MPSTSPSTFEQLVLEYMNRARTDPAADTADIVALAASDPDIASAVNFFGVNLSVFETAMAGFTAVAPLAWNAQLAEAATDHSELMRVQDAQSHQLPGEASLEDRITASGYSPYTWGENIFAYSESAAFAHAGFMIDWGYGPNGMQNPAGHRNSIMNGAFQEVGIGVVEDTDPGTQVGPYLVTQDLAASSGYQAQLLGVVINDADSDAFYDIGEGLGGITVMASGASGIFTTTSWASGGYQMVLPSGTYTVTFNGAGITGVASYTVSMGSDNLKLDGFAADGSFQQYGGSGVDSLVGSAGDDTLLGLEGNDTLIGRSGADSLVGGNEDDLLISALSDDTSYEAAAGQVFRLYRAALDRMPDMAGHMGWTKLIDTGVHTGSSAAGGFIASTEFQATYGALDDNAFVTLLYGNVLNRAPDAAGLQGWTDLLAAGTARQDVVLGFSDSAEFIRNTFDDSLGFTSAAHQIAWGDDVFRLYQATLDRAPDWGGFTAWTESLSLGANYSTVAAGFVNSTEFQNAYSATTTEQFVTLLYNNVLDRAPDSDGLAAWSGAINSGAQTRAGVVEGFAQSAEFIAATEDAVAAFLKANPNGSLSGGNGDDRMVGGLGSDSFIFQDSDAGADTVIGLEVADVLSLDGAFGNTLGEVYANMTQVGDDVLLSEGDQSVLFVNTSLALLQDPDLTILV